jgi:hypothetical protein
VFWIDRESKYEVLPGAVTKNKLEHLVPLVPQAVNLLDMLKLLAVDELGPESVRSHHEERFDRGRPPSRRVASGISPRNPQARSGPHSTRRERADEA